jgi:sugar phosphate permease
MSENVSYSTIDENDKDGSGVTTIPADGQQYQLRGIENIDVVELNLARDHYGNSHFRIKKEKHKPFYLDSVATQPSVFDDSDRAEYFLPSDDYENSHRFDKDARWTWREEFKLIRKIDWKIMAWVCVMFFGLEVDRSNLSQALSDNLLDDLALNTNDYNNGQAIFKVSFLLAELPSQLLSKKLGPDRWIPAQITLWSIVASLQFFLTGRTSFFISRSLLGIIQGGFIPDIILYLSYFYTGAELPIRCSWLWTVQSLADISSAFLGYGILHMRGFLGKAGWRWLFLLEGLLTLTIGLFSFGLMPDSPTGTASWFHGRDGWFTKREEVIMTTRILRDDPTKGHMNNREGLSLQSFLNCLKDYSLWPIYFLGILYGIPHGPVQSYLTLTLRQMGFDTFQTTLLTVPSYVILFLNLLLFTYISEVFNSRAIVASLSQWWLLPLLAILNTFTEETNIWLKYFVTTLTVGFINPHAIQVAWCSRNSNTVSTRTVSAALYNISVQTSGIIHSQVYREDDKPLYHRGNRILLSVACFNLLVYAATYTYYWRLNRRKERIWNGMTTEEQALYVQNTSEVGSRRLDFRYAY